MESSNLHTLKFNKDTANKLDIMESSVNTTNKDDILNANSNTNSNANSNINDDITKNKIQKKSDPISQLFARYKKTLNKQNIKPPNTTTTQKKILQPSKIEQKIASQDTNTSINTVPTHKELLEEKNWPTKCQEYFQRCIQIYAQNPHTSYFLKSATRNKIIHMLVDNSVIYLQPAQEPIITVQTVGKYYKQPTIPNTVPKNFYLGGGCDSDGVPIVSAPSSIPQSIPPSMPSPILPPISSPKQPPVLPKIETYNDPAQVETKTLIPNNSEINQGKQRKSRWETKPSVFATSTTETPTNTLYDMFTNLQNTGQISPWFPTTITTPTAINSTTQNRSQEYINKKQQEQQLQLQLQSPPPPPPPPPPTETIALSKKKMKEKELLERRKNRFSEYFDTNDTILEKEKEKDTITKTPISRKIQAKKKNRKEVLEKSSNNTNNSKQNNTHIDIYDDTTKDIKFIIGTCLKLEKSFLRLTTIPDPNTVRPKNILKESFKMVLNHWNTYHDYKYCCDQQKSIRQDLSIQHIRDTFTIHVYEVHARIALVVGDLSEYNQCQSQLSIQYSIAMTDDITNDDNATSSTKCENYIEFLCYRILYNVIIQNHRDIQVQLLFMDTKTRFHPAIIRVLQFRHSVQTKNYAQFFHLYSQYDIPYGCIWILHKLVNYIRHIALQRLIISMKTREIDLEYIENLLFFDTELLPGMITTRDDIINKNYTLSMIDNMKTKYWNLDYSKPIPGIQKDSIKRKSILSSQARENLIQFLKLRKVVFNQQYTCIIPSKCPTISKPTTNDQETTVKGDMDRGITHADFGLAYSC